MSAKYFSDRESGPTARAIELIDERVWNGLVIRINALANSGAFGKFFPNACPDGRGVFGTDYDAMKGALEARVPDIEFPLPADPLPPTIAILDSSSSATDM